MKHLPTLRITARAGLVAGLVAVAPLAAAQAVDFAGKRVELIVPFAPGGGADTYARAQELLGRLAEEGRGTTTNAIQAYIWYKLAAQNGLASAQPAMERVARRLQPAEIVQADHSVRGWAPESAP